MIIVPEKGTMDGWMGWMSHHIQAAANTDSPSLVPIFCYCTVTAVTPKQYSIRIQWKKWKAVGRIWFLNHHLFRNPPWSNFLRPSSRANESKKKTICQRDLDLDSTLIHQLCFRTSTQFESSITPTSWLLPRPMMDGLGPLLRMIPACSAGGEHYARVWNWSKRRWTVNDRITFSWDETWSWFSWTHPSSPPLVYWPCGPRRQNWANPSITFPQRMKIITISVENWEKQVDHIKYDIQFVANSVHATRWNYTH